MQAKQIIKITNRLYLPQLPPEARETLKERLTFANPKWVENRRMGRWNKGTPKVLRFYRRAGEGLRIPRGYIRHLINFFRKEGLAFDWHCKPAGYRPW